MKSTKVLTLYSLEEEDHSYLKKKFDTYEIIIAGSLRDRSLLRIFKKLREISPRDLYVNTTTAPSSVQKLLKLLGLFTRSENLYELKNGEAVPYGLWDLVSILLSFIFENIVSWIIFLKQIVYASFYSLLKSYHFEGASLKKNRILYIKTNYWVGVKAGGSVGHIAGVIKGFIDHRSRVTYLGVDKPIIEHSFLRLHCLLPKIGLSFPEELNHYAFDHQILNEGCKVVSGELPDLIYQRMSICNFTGVVIARKFKIPLILEYNGSEVWISKNWGTPLKFEFIANLIERINFKHAHRIVTVSSVLRDDLISRGVAEEKIIVYPNCIDPVKFDPARFSLEDRELVRKKYQITKRQLLFTFVGTYGKWHGVDVLAKAINVLVNEKKDFFNECKFLMIGNGPEKQNFKKILGDNFNEKFIIDAGVVEQDITPKYLFASDVLLSPHVNNPDGGKFFGSPTKLFEYMAMSKVIIASDLEQLSEVLLNGARWPKLPEAHNDSICVQPGLERDLAECLYWVSKNYYSLQSLRENTRKRCLEHYTWEKHVDAILQGIKE